MESTVFLTYVLQILSPGSERPQLFPGQQSDVTPTAYPAVTGLRSGGRVPGQWSTGAEGARPASGGGDGSRPGARPARRLSPGLRRLLGWGKVGGRGRRGRGHSAPRTPTPPPTAAFVSEPGPRPPSRPQPAPRPALPGGASKVAARASPRAPPPSRGVAGSRRRRRGAGEEGAARGSAAAAAAGGGGRRRERESLAQGEGERDAASEQGAGAGSAGGGGPAREPGGGRTSPMQSSPGAPRSPASQAALRADRPVPQPYNAPQSCPFVVSWWDPRCRAEEAGCSAVPGSEAPLPPAPERVGRKGLSCPSLGKGLRSFRSEVQPPAAVI
ncbi:hypothetical protein R6Z07F_013058 [Ovis aries]